MLPVLRDVKAKIRSSAVSQYYRRRAGKEYMGYSLRTDEYRYVEWRDFGTGEIVSKELYDHRAKSNSHLGVPETKNLAESASKELLAELSRQLRTTHPARRLVMTPAVRLPQRIQGRSDCASNPSQRSPSAEPKTRARPKCVLCRPNRRRVRG